MRTWKVGEEEDKQQEENEQILENKRGNRKALLALTDDMVILHIPSSKTLSFLHHPHNTNTNTTHQQAWTSRWFSIAPSATGC
jgi:hypothetical protein